MKTNLGLRTIVTSAIIVFAAFAPASIAADVRRPNFIFFFTDDQPYNAMGCSGNEVIKTPNMDRLAADGVFFEQAFVTTAICCVSRASILTGQHQRRHGVEDFQKPFSSEQMQKTFPVLLRKAGYRTAFLGKFAIGSPAHGELSLPADQFDLWYGFPQAIAFKQMIDGQPRYLTTVMTEKAVDFIRRSKLNEPFCMIVAFKEPHGPRNYFDPEYENPYADVVIPRPASLTRESFDAMPPFVREGLNANPRLLSDPEYFQEHMRQTYALISRADLAVGQICRALEDRGLDKNTVVIFSSDHGHFDGAHGLNGKWLMYEESIKVPLIIHDPRLPAAARGRRTQMALNIDIAPTILSMAGVPVPAGMQGIDLHPILRDPASKGRDDWYYEHTYQTKPPRAPIPQSEGVRTERWKYIRYTEPNPPLEQLFDLAVDPGEENDLAADPAHARTLAELRARCDAYRESLK